MLYTNTELHCSHYLICDRGGSVSHFLYKEQSNSPNKGRLFKIKPSKVNYLRSTLLTPVPSNGLEKGFRLWNNQSYFASFNVYLVDCLYVFWFVKILTSNIKLQETYSVWNSLFCEQKSKRCVHMLLFVVTLFPIDFNITGLQTIKKIYIKIQNIISG